MKSGIPLTSLWIKVVLADLTLLFLMGCCVGAATITDSHSSVLHQTIAAFTLLGWLIDVLDAGWFNTVFAAGPLQHCQYFLGNSFVHAVFKA